MKLSERIARWFTVPVLTPTRIACAFAVAVATDGLQILLGPIGTVLLLDEVLDVVAMILITAALGFHVLLLPTFIIELLPVADWLPTWTGCTAVVVALRKAAKQPNQPPQPQPPIIDIPSEVTHISSTLPRTDANRR
jgi:hypothetical protein